ncbi:MAG TPA: hypothetical protein PLZ65_04590 [Limnochordia bacterium]|nr:hypothetical protein [Limnochordia bacterium]
MAAQKGVVILVKKRIFHLVFLLTLLLPSPILARDYIDIWPEGWSEVAPLFTTSIFTDRFFVTHDAQGTSFLSADGTYFKETNLTYRRVYAGAILEEVVLRSQVELDSIFLGLGEGGRRHVLWLEHGPQGSSIQHTSFGVPYAPEGVLTVLSAPSTIQDLAADQAGETTHLAWSQRDRFFQIRYTRIQDGEIAAVETVTDTEELSVRPSLVVDSRGTVHLAWMETGPAGVEIRYSRRTEEGWTTPRRVGEGSVQDIQQGGLIALAAFGEEVHLAWAALPRGSSRLHIYHASISAEGEVSPPQVLAPGSKPRFVQGTDRPELVWQSPGAYGVEIHYLPPGEEPINLTVGRRGAFRPEAFADGQYRYVFWLHASPEGGYEVVGINNQFPKALSLWRQMGIDEEAPWYHVGFLFLSTLMLSMVYTAANLGVILLAAGLYSLLQKVERYRRQPIWYQVALSAALLVVLRRLPFIPATHPQFFGPLHHLLCVATATLGTWLLLHRVRQRGFLFTMAALVIWMVLFQFAALIPQNILL